MTRTENNPKLCHCRHQPQCQGIARYEALLKESSGLLKKAWQKIARYEGELEQLEKQLAEQNGHKPASGAGNVGAHGDTAAVAVSAPRADGDRLAGPEPAAFTPLPLTGVDAETVTVPAAAALETKWLLAHMQKRHNEPPRGYSRTRAAILAGHSFGHTLADALGIIPDHQHRRATDDDGQAHD